MAHRIDVTDRNGKLTGRQVTWDEAHAQGIWHRTAQVVIYTSDGHILVEKRSSTIIQNPRLLDISVGGVVYAGETPEDAIIRRSREELDIEIIKSDLRFVEITRYNHSLPRAGKHSKAVLFNFILQLPSQNVTLRYLKNDVAWAGFISLEKANTLVFTGKLDSIGKLVPRYSYYRKLVRHVEAALKEE